MRLLAFRVRDFRSVDDTGWIEAEQITALIGTNEAGKTNVLTPLWKLKPAKDGAIEPIADYPRKRYNAIRELARKPIFIDARFELPDALSKRLSKVLRVSADLVKEAIVSRDFDGQYFVAFRKADDNPVVSRAAIVDELNATLIDVRTATILEDEEELKRTITGALQRGITLLEGYAAPEIEGAVLAELEAILAGVDLTGAAKFSLVTGRFTQLSKMVSGLPALASDTDRQAARELVVAQMPSFVYYSNFGNLDAEIYLPHVIENLKRTDLGSKEAAKARTLKVLFDFVKLSPEEILALGHEALSGPLHPAPEQEAAIAAAAKQKKEREILLQSAASELTRSFREWWKQGDYVFRFQADGDHFRIWVSDGKRPEPIELEARSTGLQFFLSFYLVFIVESVEIHQGAILLLDEPGLSLHPMAQHDLSAFFEGLARSNQLIYTTHSPFMLDTDHMDRTRSVYSDDKGITQVTSDLRMPLDRSDQSKSMYVAYAAAALSAADAALLACQPVIVETVSDQHYLTAMKDYLIGRGLLNPYRDILFLPGGSAKGTRNLSGLVSGPGDPLPFVVLDSDANGRQLAHGLKTSFYQQDQEKVLAVGDFRKVIDAEIEDLFPASVIAKAFDRFVRKPSGVDEDFADIMEEGQAFLPQAEAYARKHKIELDERWKIDLARRVKSAVVKAKGDVLRREPDYLDVWQRIFALIHPTEPAAIS